ncbi:MAG: putative metallopeptidase, partial [Candidatus Diapherotrites archaeon]|nr:putative metallopeptidase [Candidatus Diapherotrites archaeon]
SKKMKYEFSPEWTQKALELCEVLGFAHVKKDRIKCFKSWGTSTRRTIARIHGLGKLMQLTLGINAAYAIELISEKFDNQPEAEKIKTLIHELMHIPHSFGGGFRQHKPFVTHKQVELVYEKYLNLRQKYL